MLRTELQAVLNDVVAAAQEAAEGHEAAAEMVVGDPELAGMLRDLAQARRAAAEDLADEVRRLGDLPRAPNADLEAVREALTFVKAAFSLDEGRTVVEDRAHAEAALGEAVATALAHPELPQTARRRLEALDAEIREAHRQLQALGFTRN
jgi:uncharacterized protein (TIGR02284 family)